MPQDKKKKKRSIREIRRNPRAPKGTRSAAKVRMLDRAVTVAGNRSLDARRGRERIRKRGGGRAGVSIPPVKRPKPPLGKKDRINIRKG